MNAAENQWMEVVLIISLAVSLVTALVAAFCLLKIRRLSAEKFELSRRLESSLKVINSSAVGMGRKIAELDRQMQAAEDLLQHDQESPSKTPDRLLLDDSLADASALLSAGVDADEVARRCGISRAEAGLMKLLRAHLDKTSAA